MARWIAAEKGWTKACSSMPDGDGKDQVEDSPKQACSCWFARPCLFVTSGANFYPPGVFLFCLSIPYWLSLVFCFCFRFVSFFLSPRLFDFIESAALRSIVRRYACAPAATRSYIQHMSVSPFVLFIFRLFGDVAFFGYFCTNIIATSSNLLYGEYLVLSPLPNGVYPVTTPWILA